MSVCENAHGEEGMSVHILVGCLWWSPSGEGGRLGAVTVDKQDHEMFGGEYAGVQVTMN